MSRQSLHVGHAKILLGKDMDFILNFLKRAEDQLSENVYFYTPQIYYF